MRKLIVLLLFFASKGALSQQITITLTEPVTTSVPVRVQLSKPLKSTIYLLKNVKTNRQIPAQALDSVTLLFMSEEKLPIGDHAYTVTATGKGRKSSGVSIEKKANGLLARVHNKPVFFYHTSEAMPPADSPSYYKRSGFIHPLYSPSGRVLTDDFPVGHAHQHAIFTAWTSTVFRNSSVDFWNQQSKKGTVEHTGVIAVDEGAVVTRIVTSLRHKSLQFGEVLKEKWILTIYPIDKYFLFDLESEQQNVTNDTLFLNKYHYGGLAFRGSRQWNIEDHKNYRRPWKILTSEGVKDSSANATHARWVEAWGQIEDGVAGVSVFNHPTNFRFPQALRVHPVMPYWAYSPVVDGAFYIPPGAYYRSKFRYYVHDGEVNPEMIEKLYKEWAAPPKATATYK